MDINSSIRTTTLSTLMFCKNGGSRILLPTTWTGVAILLPMAMQKTRNLFVSLLPAGARTLRTNGNSNVKPKKSEASDEQVEHGEECHLFIEDDPNYQVSFRSDNGHVYTFYVRADDPQDALDRAYHEFGVNYNMSIKGEAHSESDIPQDVEAVEVGTKYAPKVNVAVDPWDGKGVPFCNPQIHP